ncbi:MinD/ParA family ATP-binding protein [Nocardiopsis suaedae]|uniref:Chromosome partitioning protein n=1 Tax=Nocardiopsis suaedae TaxID=3018444 RepID=A0ABT4TFA0_9ACTN|nr:hypothetical protein [Nocardiopsis suaedae]MDA2803306.1 hypothetical protein [Nocardiopsis suaedae]
MSVRSPHPEPAADGEGSGASAPAPLSELSADTLIRRERPAPKGGWRRALYTVTGGRINPGDSKTEQRRQELEAAVGRAPLPEEHQSIVVLGTGAGVGTTTVALALGAVLAAHRGDRVIAVDGDPERAPITERMALKWHAELPLQDLIASPDAAVRYSDMNRFTAQTTGGLDVLASTPDDTASRPLGLESVRRISDAVERHYPLQLVDAGTGLDRPGVPVLLARCTRLVLVSPATREGAVAAANALDEVDAVAPAPLAGTAAVVLAKGPSGGPGTSPEIDDLEQQMDRRCARALQLPEDPHLASDRPVDLADLRAPSALALLELAVEITEGFARPDQEADGPQEG